MLKLKECTWTKKWTKTRHNTVLTYIDTAPNVFHAMKVLYNKIDFNDVYFYSA